MLYVLLVTTRPLDIEYLRSAAPDMLPVEQEAGRDRFVFAGVNPSLDIGLEPGLDTIHWQDEPERLARIASIGPSREIYFVHYRCAERLKAVLCRVANSAEFLIDDDYDLFVTGDEFVRRCAAAPGRNDWWLGDIHV